ncbi:hypothetical protein V6N11_077379 [Hibiscus sabdariffa]|uniref:SET domain-containing protein n=1 Tax=Hibiscus sabdariffa TaxID=183260 RepID=A0ABR2TCY7_9ROSI
MEKVGASEPLRNFPKELLFASLSEKYSPFLSFMQGMSSILLDAYWGLKGVSKDEEALCLDATCYGNVARFINHSCLDANLIEIPVEVETSDLHYYHLAFFTTREVHALEELTWLDISSCIFIPLSLLRGYTFCMHDYGIDFDDLDHPVKTSSADVAGPNLQQSPDEPILCHVIFLPFSIYLKIHRFQGGRSKHLSFGMPLHGVDILTK